KSRARLIEGCHTLKGRAAAHPHPTHPTHPVAPLQRAPPPSARMTSRSAAGSSVEWPKEAWVGRARRMPRGLRRAWQEYAAQRWAAYSCRTCTQGHPLGAVDPAASGGLPGRANRPSRLLELVAKRDRPYGGAEIAMSRWLA